MLPMPIFIFFKFSGEIFVQAICLVEGNCSVKDAAKNMSAVMSFYPHLAKVRTYIIYILL